MMKPALLFLSFSLFSGCSAPNPTVDAGESDTPPNPGPITDAGTRVADAASSSDPGEGPVADAGLPASPDGEAPDAGLDTQDAGAPANPMDPENDAGISTGSAVPASLTAILDEIPGWGAGTIGGRDGTIYTVTNLQNSGSGSLREALESPEPLWIVFEPGLNGILQMENSIRVKSFKTVDARGHDITLRASDDWSGGLRIGTESQPEVEHVIILNLKFDGQWPDYTEDSEGDDGINIRNGSHHVWVHHCSFTNWIDGAIDAKADAGFPIPHHITISKSYFTKTHQPLAVAINYLTFARNHCIDVTKRCVQLNLRGRGHMVNNVVEDWRAASIVAPKDGAQLLVDHNLFKPGPDCDTVGTQIREDTDDYGHWQNERNHWRLSWGWVAFKKFTSVDDELFDDARETYPPVQCGAFDFDCWDALYDAIVAEAGAQP